MTDCKGSNQVGDDQGGLCPGGGRLRRALVVDRSPLLRDGLRVYLEALGWTVVTVGSMAEGLGLLVWSPVPVLVPGSITPDLIVMGEIGAGRAGVTGPTLVERLAALRQTRRPLLLSLAEANRDLTEQACSLGFETIHIGLPPLNLDRLLRDCVRLIEGEIRAEALRRPLAQD